MKVKKLITSLDFFCVSKRIKTENKCTDFFLFQSHNAYFRTTSPYLHFANQKGRN